MGIRIHKVLGYGFRRTHLRRDPRFNSHALPSLDAAAHDARLDGDLRPKLIAFIEEKAQTAPGDQKWEYRLELNALKGEDRENKAEKLESISFYDVVVNSPFTGEARPPIGPLLFTIPYQNWKRYDDIIDYYEDTQQRVRQDGGAEDKCVLLTDCEGQPTGIYPYVSYVHRTKGPLGKNVFTAARWELTRVFRKLGQTQLKSGNPFLVDNPVQWQRHIVPEVPLFIRAFCECFEIFKDPKTVQRLRPMLYTYWS
jgi:hypothetical protein